MDNIKDGTFKLSSVQDALKNIKLNIPDIKPIELPIYDNIYDNAKIKESMEAIARINREKNERELENNNSLKTIVQYNQDIANYNKELVNLNEKILKKINSLDDTLIFLNNAFNNKSGMDKEQAQQQTALLLELITILDSRDEKKIKKFMDNVSVPVGVGLIVEYLKIKLGIS